MIDNNKIEILERALKREKAARKAAESILEQKSYELYNLSQELKISNEKLAESLSQKTSELEGVFFNIIDAYIVMDVMGNVLSMNDAAVQMLGYDAGKESFNLTTIVKEEYLEYTAKVFKELYEKYEKTRSIRKKTLPALEVFQSLLTERKDTGRIYIMNVDHANDHGSFDPKVAPIKMSNLCCEIDLPTKPLSSADDEEGEISLCTLSAINWGLINDPSEFEKYCDLAVRSLDELLDYQDYPVKAAERSTMNRRPLGIGVINLAYFLAKRGMKYDEGAFETVDQYAEAWSYYLIKASADIAKEKGKIPLNNETKYGSGALPIDTYKSAVDNLIEHNERLPWDLLRTQLKATGIRNSTLMALMPAETSAQISNSTNGIEPPRALVSYKQSKDGVMAQVVPGYHHLKNKYDLLWDQKSPDGYLKICAILQKYIDQGISVNTSYNPEHFEDNKIPMSEMIKDTVTAYKFGLKQLYYFNTFDGSGEITDEATHHSYEGEAVTYEEDDCESCKI